MKSQNKRVSQYTGVNWNRKLQKWTSSVSKSGVKYDCGFYEKERDAAKARDRKILVLGLNKPLQILKPAA